MCGKPFVDTKELPQWIRQIEQKSKSTFLRAIFDDDGTVCKGASDGGGRYIRIVQKSESIINVVSYLLNEIGVPTNETKSYLSPNGNNYFFVTITSKVNLSKFKQLVHFNHPQKKEKLESLLGSYQIA